MDDSTLHRSPEETAAIEKHKYYLSEKAGHDVGWQAALEDWERQYGKKIRQTDQRVSSPAAAANGTSTAVTEGTWWERLLTKAGMR